jgi:hypothetical protein
MADAAAIAATRPTAWNAPCTARLHAAALIDAHTSTQQ